MLYKTISIRIDMVRSSMEAVRRDPQNTDLQYRLGVAQYVHGDDERAVIAFAGAIHANPSHAWASYNLGLALRNLGRYDESSRAFQRALHLDPHFVVVLGRVGRWAMD